MYVILGNVRHTQDKGFSFEYIRVDRPIDYIFGRHDRNSVRIISIVDPKLAQLRAVHFGHAAGQGLQASILCIDFGRQVPNIAKKIR